MSKYINPFTDTGFKIIFGKEHVSNDILKSFLNVLFEGDPILSNIKSLEYRPNEKTREWEHGKSIAYDIHCETSTGHRFIVEMQLSKQEHFLKRVQYYLCRMIAEQGYKGTIDPLGDNDAPGDGDTQSDTKRYWDYNVVPVVGVFFTDFFIKGLDKKLLTRCRIMDQETHKPVGDEMRMVFIQVPAFNKKEEECVTFFDQWMFNLKNMDHMDRMRFTSHQDIFKRLDKVANYATLSPEERRQYEYDLKRARDYHAELAYARKEAMIEGRAEGHAEGMAQGRAEGRAEGMAQGRAEGRAEGMAQGRAEGMAQGRAEGLAEGIAKGVAQGVNEGKIAVARTLKLYGMSDEEIADITQLNIESIRQL